MLFAPASLNAISTPRWLAACAFDWACIGLSFAALASSSNPLVWGAGLLVIGARQLALATLAHDGAHRRIARSTRANVWLANGLAFGPLGVDVERFRAYHLAHHSHLGTTEDPESELYALPQPTRSLAGLAKRFLADCLGAGAPGTLRTVRRLGFRGRAAWIFGACVAAVTVATAAAGLWWVVPVWFGAQLTTFTALFQLRLLAEHTGIPGTHRVEPGPLGKFFVFAHNAWCHDEHHRWAGIPCYRLPAARRYTRPEGASSPTALYARLAAERRENERRPSRRAAASLAPSSGVRA